MAEADIVRRLPCPVRTSARPARSVMLGSMPDVFEDALLARIESIPSRDGAEERRRQVDELVERSNGSRAPLEALRARYMARLYGDSSDYEATEALRVVGAALTRIPVKGAEFAWQQRERRRDGPRRRR